MLRLLPLLLLAGPACAAAKSPRGSGEALLPSEDCALSADERIFGGTVASIGDFPWLALLQYRSPDGELAYQCGGALISRRYVLTAAHCLKRKPGGGTLVGVRLGEYDLRTEFDCFDSMSEGGERTCADPPLDVEPEQAVPHHAYTGADTDFQHDIGLLRLDQDIRFTDFIRPICLPSGAELNQTLEGQKLVAAGWGRTETGAEQSPVLLRVALPAVPTAQCAAQFSSKARLRVDTTRQMCAGGEAGRDSCRGDSGGPLMAASLEGALLRYTAVGVASYGADPCGQARWPGVYTRVAAYRSWILRNLRP